MRPASWLRGPFGIALRRALQVAWLPTALVALAAALLQRAMRFTAGPDAPAAATAFLTAPLATAAGCAALSAVLTWPMFALDRPGRDQVRRLARGPLRGRGAALLGAITAQLLLSLPVAVAMAASLGAPPQAARRIAAEPTPMPLLDHQTPRQRFTLPRAIAPRELWLRPLATMPTGADYRTELRLSLDDAPLATTVVFEQSLELRKVTLPADLAPATTITVELVRGDLPLFFPRGSVEVIGPAELPRWGNAALLAALSAAGSALALAIAALVGVGCGGATVAAATGAALFVQWIGGAGPLADALQDLLRGHWIGP
ncbi:MAG: hypothetical protein R3F29_06655 [Planctomycetota bacterium]